MSIMIQEQIDKMGELFEKATVENQELINFRIKASYLMLDMCDKLPKDDAKIIFNFLETELKQKT